MPEISAVSVSERQPVGSRFQQGFLIQSVNQGATDEWIDTGFSQITNIIGWYLQEPGGRELLFSVNAEGTGVEGGLDGPNPGKLGFQVNGAGGDALFVVNVQGKP